ncbi:cytochrome o ubiquinol oxidase subunit IV [Paenibacillus wulumuqiensis]|uniref:cytochrome o ubiquinol oxidase subunit IV n=1 Tax=Paenibacillus wulumuqiensis TaxID=1567107 RepID=UPI000619F00B|nr:cytochrome o ubiquinol oxidase subunit IV [Paenibacillus wulumuqiensis]
MADHSNHAHGHNEAHAHGSVKSYVIGFVLSIILTIIPLVVVLNHMLSEIPTILVIMITAVLQFAVQLFFFMHVRERQGNQPRWNVMALIFGLAIVLVVVSGSVWIMAYNGVGY